MAKEELILTKEVDWSLLNKGFSIPVKAQEKFVNCLENGLTRGQSEKICLSIGDKSFIAEVSNYSIKEELKKTDTVQVHYSFNSELGKYLRVIFAASYERLSISRDKKVDNAESSKEKEYLIVFSSETDGKFVLEPIVLEDIEMFKHEMSSLDEVSVENEINRREVDESARLEKRIGLVTIRKLNRSICDNLKRRYDFRCQICGKRIGEEYGACVIDAHHIDYFVNSQNNNEDNILIVCPNHHRIIHEMDPIFDRENLKFIYSNGYEEKIVLNYHL